jgi:hypothetical protein
MVLAVSRGQPSIAPVRELSQVLRTNVVHCVRCLGHRRAKMRLHRCSIFLTIPRTRVFALVCASLFQQ